MRPWKLENNSTVEFAPPIINENDAISLPWRLLDFDLNMEPHNLPIVNVFMPRIDQRAQILKNTSTPFMVFSATCVIVSLTLFWDICYSMNDYQLSSWVSPHNTRRSSALANILAWVCSIVLWGACLCYAMVCELTENVHKSHLPISTLKNIFLLHTKM